MFNKLNDFFAIENKEYKKHKREYLKQNIKIEEYKNELI